MSAPDLLDLLPEDVEYDLGARGTVRFTPDPEPLADAA